MKKIEIDNLKVDEIPLDGNGTIPLKWLEDNHFPIFESIRKYQIKQSISKRSLEGSLSFTYTFNWSKTSEDHNFWYDILVDRKIETFYKRYPKTVPLEIKKKLRYQDIDNAFNILFDHDKKKI